MKTITVLVDTREKYPVTFPDTIDWWPYPDSKKKQVQLRVVHKKMETGDVGLEGLEHVSLFEFKRGARELHQNLLTARDRGRFLKAIERLSTACQFPYLLVECHPWELYIKSEEVPDPCKLFDSLAQVIHRYGLRLLYAGGCQRPDRRRILGEQVVRILLAHAYDPSEGIDRAEVNKLLGLD